MARAKGDGSPRRLFAAKSSFSVIDGGAQTFIAKGDLVDDGDPIYRKHKAQFEEPRPRRYGRVTNDAPVEQATAAPGEQRVHTHPH